MERAAAGQAAFRHPSPAPATACAPAPGEHDNPPSGAPRVPPGNRGAAAARAAALNGTQGG